MEIAQINKNIALEGLLRLIRESLQASLSMKQIPLLEVQDIRQAQRTHRYAYISTSQITCSPTVASQYTATVGQAPTHEKLLAIQCHHQ